MAVLARHRQGWLTAVLGAAFVAAAVLSLGSVRDHQDRTRREADVEEALTRAQSAVNRLLADLTNPSGDRGASDAVVRDDVARLREARAGLAAVERDVGAEIARQLDVVVDAAGPPPLLMVENSAIRVNATIDDVRGRVLDPLGRSTSLAATRMSLATGLFVAVGLAVVVRAGTVLARRTRRRAVAATERSYRLILDDLSERVCRYRAEDLRVEYCNAAWAARHGVAPEQLVGRTLHELLSPDQLELVEQGVSRLGLDQSLVPTRVADRTGGQARFEEWVDRLVPRADGTDVLAVGRDVTRSVEAEEALRASEARYRMFAEATNDGVCVLDRDGRLLEANGLFLTRLGYDVSAPPRTIADWDVQLAGEDVARALAPAFDAPGRTEGWHRRADGSAYPAEVDMVPGELGGEDVLFCTVRDLTARYAAEAQVADSERQLRAILEAIDRGVLLHDATGTVTFANRVAARIVGEAAARQLMGGSTDALLRMLAVDQDDGRGIGIVEHVLRTGERVQGAEVAIRVDTGVRWLRLTAIPMTDAAGAAEASSPVAVHAVVLSFADVTAEHEAQAALAASEARYRSVVETVSEGLVLQDADGAIVTVNPAMERLLALPMDRIGDSSSREAGWVPVDTDLRPLARDEYAPEVVRRTGRPIENRLTGLRLPGGEMRWLRTTCHPILTDGKVSSVVTAVTDVTAEHEARRALEASEAQFRLLTEHASDLVVRFGLDGCFLYVSPSSVELLGRDPNHLVGRPVTTIVHPGDAAFLPDVVEEVARLGLDSPGGRSRARLVHAAGHARWFEAAWKPLAGPTGVVEIHCIVRDVQDSKDAEEALEHTATHDPLTGLANRVLLLRRLEAVLADPGQAGSVAVLFVDLDGFKPVNDRFGHDAGDDVLVQVGERLRRHVRSTDLVARMGGDEFVVLVTGFATPQEVQGLARRIEAAIGEPILLDGGVARIGASIGMALGRTYPTVDGLLSAADTAMYDAKRIRGTNR